VDSHLIFVGVRYAVLGEYCRAAACHRIPPMGGCAKAKAVRLKDARKRVSFAAPVALTKNSLFLLDYVEKYSIII
jgi:hypothetical protein